MKVSIRELGYMYGERKIPVGSKLLAEKDKQRFVWVIFWGNYSGDWFKDFITKCRTIGLKDDEKGITITRV